MLAHGSFSILTNSPESIIEPISTTLKEMSSDRVQGAIVAYAQYWPILRLLSKLVDRVLDVVGRISTLLNAVVNVVISFVWS